MHRIKILFKYIKAIFTFIKSSETLSNILYELAVSKYVFGNEKFKDWVKTKNIVEKLDIAQKTIDKTTKLISNTEVNKAIKVINESKTGPFKNISAKVHKNKHGGSNHGIELGISAEIQGTPVHFGYSTEGDKRLEIGPLAF